MWQFGKYIVCNVIQLVTVADKYIKNFWLITNNYNCKSDFQFIPKAAIVTNCGCKRFYCFINIISVGILGSGHESCKGCHHNFHSSFSTPKSFM